MGNSNILEEGVLIVCRKENTLNLDLSSGLAVYLLCDLESKC